MIEEHVRERRDRPTRPRSVRVLVAVVAALPALLVGLYVSATTFPNTSFVPWRPNMVDLAVYQLAGETLRAGGDPYDLPGNLPFLYPPFAALLAVPLSYVPATVIQLVWATLNVLAILAIMRRLGVRGWPLALGAPAVIWFVEPVRQTFAFGQVGAFLVAMVVLDLVPGRRDRTGRRRVWTGWLSGLATAVKLTPGLFSVHLWLVGRRRAALVSVGAFLAVSLVAAVIDPGLSAGFWGRLVHGDTGLGNSIIYTMNQSVMGGWLRIFGIGGAAKATGLALSAAVAALGVVAAYRWHRRGQPVFALCLVGLASLLASPVSWSHHFVWVVPIGLSLLAPGLPRALRLLTLVWVGWVIAAPFTSLPRGGDVELDFTWSQNLMGSAGTALGVAVLVVALLLTRTRAPVAQPGRTTSTLPHSSDASAPA